MVRPRERVPLGTLGRAGAALALAYIAGFVDAIAFLLLKQVFTSHMTGNTASLAQHAAHEQAHAAWLNAWPLIAFFAGLMLSAAMGENSRRRRHNSRLAPVLGLEILALLVLLVWGHTGSGGSMLWVGLPAFAMGMQTVTVTRVGDQRVYTTYVTGTLSKLAEAIVGWFYWLADHRRGIGDVAGHPLLNHAVFTFGLWALFLAGGLCGALAELAWAMPALLGPLAGLVALALLDLARPIAPIAPNEPVGFRM